MHGILLLMLFFKKNKLLHVVIIVIVANNAEAVHNIVERINFKLNLIYFIKVMLSINFFFI